jgi:hypothetical protein
MNEDNHISDIAAMRTLLAGLMMVVHRHKYPNDFAKNVAKRSVDDADALIVELSKNTNQNEPKSKPKSRQEKGPKRSRD